MNYLELITGALITDMIIMIGYFNGIFSPVLSKWYQSFGLGAVISDVTVIVLCIAISFFLYPYLFSKFNLFKFTGLAVAIQIVHDFIFGYIISNIDTGKSPIFSVFKSYIKDGGYYIILADSFMIVSTIMIMKFLERFSKDTNIFIFILSLYILTYILYSF